MKYITPEKDLKDILLSIQKPGRYVGGEFGISKKEDAILNVGISFPDLYEIGMSNFAIKILYNILNSIEGVRCERVFAPAVDFEDALKSKNIPLYTLESGIPLKDLDIIAFTFGYELCSTNILSILNSGEISLETDSRKEKDPIVIAGGPAVSNTAPLLKFIDAIFIGEAEAYIKKLFTKLVLMKKNNASRSDLLEKILSYDNVSSKFKNGKAKRSIWNDFSSSPFLPKNFPIPNIKVIQDNGVSEIMRGCPNGCRFCHAGYFYRPYRQKEMKHILSEVDYLVHKCGYREITLASLSSGDYPGIEYLTKSLNNIYKNQKISFSLPSLKLNTFALELLSELSTVRKSGLTFAVETPTVLGQLALNKEVPLERTIEILNKAKKYGYRQAKFYFLMGLPVGDRKKEITQISDFIKEVYNKTKVNININLGTFIPKPHTPFQWADQLSVDDTLQNLNDFKQEIKSYRNVKIGFHDPFSSYLEGIISRGDERVSDIIYSAFKNGARLDAWQEHINKDVWKKAISDQNWNVDEILNKRNVDEDLPWDNIDVGVSKSYLKKEFIKSQNHELTKECSNICSENCGVCGVKNTISEIEVDNVIEESLDEINEEVEIVKLLFQFEKKSKAIFISHLNIMSIFEKTIQRAGYSINFSNGFNPKPKLVFASPLSLGISSSSEIASIELINMNNNLDIYKIKNDINEFLPMDIKIIDIKKIEVQSKKTKLKSLMAAYAGAKYKISFKNKILNPQGLLKHIEEYYKLYKFDISNESCTENDNILVITLPYCNIKASNISFLIEYLHSFDEDFEIDKIERVKMYGKIDNEDKELSDFFDLF